MHSTIFERMVGLASDIRAEFTNSCGEPLVSKDLSRFPWQNDIFRSKAFRRGHLEVLDVRDTKKMWIMHVCIFPHLDDSSPIFGFDVICGANKITGVFLDFSITGDKDHPMVHWFRDRVKDVSWKKDRELPDWGKAIFSPYMIAAGNVNTDEELEKIIVIAKECLSYYIANVGNTIHNTSFCNEHNFYCKKQKENQHTPRFLINCGVSEGDAMHFMHKHLFPEVA